MDLESPYLKAIQEISGTTPGVKYKNLNSMARDIIEGSKSHGDSTSRLSYEKVPEPLIPIVRVEIAKSLRQVEILVNALKSDDSEIVDRALRNDWFFRPDNAEIMNVEYFQINIFPKVSLNTRLKVIKKIASSLRANGDNLLAEKFYSLIVAKYGKKQAEPMLIACGETFVWDTVVASKIILSCRLVKNLFLVYPELVIRYLKLSKTSVDNEETGRNFHDVKISKYSDFLPRLIKNHIKALIELIEMHNATLGIQLSNKATERFLKCNVDVVLNNPRLYLDMMPLKVVTAKLTKSQFTKMFARLYPARLKDFDWSTTVNYLKYYPEQERLSLILDTYRKLYNCSLLDNDDAMNEQLIGMLPTEQRAQKARAQLAKWPDWRDTRWRIERMWRCYLPIDESLTSIKHEISKTSSSDDRSLLLQQMIFTCKINDDKDALLDALRYFTTRHKNEQINVIYDVLRAFSEYIDLSSLEKEHWSIIDDFMHYLQIKDELVGHSTAIKILTGSIHFKILHDMSHDDELTIMTDILIRGWDKSWSLFEKNPEYDRMTFDKMMSIVSTKYPHDHAIWKNPRIHAITDIIETMKNFNKRNAKVKIDKLTIVDYPWLLDATKRLVDMSADNRRYNIDEIVDYLKTQETELYDEWIKIDENAIADVKSDEARILLKREPLKILNNCDVYLERLKSCVTYNRWAQRFVKSCRWYQEIPIKFLRNCLDELKHDDVNDNCLIILGILVEGSTFSRIIEPLVPQDSTIDVAAENARENYKIVFAIPRAMNLTNPPVALSLVSKFCHGEYLNLGLVTLENASRRLPADEIEKFARQLSDQRVSVKKHGIRLFCMVATIDDYRKFLSDLWLTNEHRSIRAVVFKKIRNLFIEVNGHETWKLLYDCLAGLADDDVDCLDDCVTFTGMIPDQYYADWTMKLFEIVEKLYEHDVQRSNMIKHLGDMLNNIDGKTSRLLPEEFSILLLKRYFLNVDRPSELRLPGMRYVVNGYLRAIDERLDQRLVIFAAHYADLLRKQWNVKVTEGSIHCPINWMNKTFVNDVAFNYDAYKGKEKIMRTILDTYNAVLEPHDDWLSYAILSIGVKIEKSDRAIVMAEKICNLLADFVDKLTIVMVPEIAGIVENWIDLLIDLDTRQTFKYDVIEYIYRDDDPQRSILAAKLLSNVNYPNNNDNQRHNGIVEFMKKSRNPAVLSILNQHINNCA